MKGFSSLKKSVLILFFSCLMCSTRLLYADCLQEGDLARLLQNPNKKKIIDLSQKIIGSLQDQQNKDQTRAIAKGSDEQLLLSADSAVEVGGQLSPLEEVIYQSVNDFIEEKGRYAEALRALQFIGEKLPQWAKAWPQWNSDQRQSAETEFFDLIDLAGRNICISLLLNDDPCYYMLLGMVNMLSGDMQEAKECFEESLAIDSEQSKFQNGTTSTIYCSSNPSLFIQDTRKMIAMCDDMLKLPPRDDYEKSAI